ncbi:hypothetical protein J6590_062497 [Homalodisca vitripennis]|nr:hypothetical protein J6590_064218 [Homalodisca vitripennis]KAG8335675.1 hypothetical protein J6590_062497 [Homalodisca vitripennis]
MHFNRKGKRKIGEEVLRLLRDGCFNHAAITKKKISQPLPEEPVIIVEGLRSQLEIMVRKDSTEHCSSDKSSLLGSTTNLLLCHRDNTPRSHEYGRPTTLPNRDFCLLSFQLFNFRL